MADDDFIFAVDLGGTHLRAAIVDRRGKIHHRLKRHTPKVTQPQEMVHALVEAELECESKTGDLGKVAAVSVAVPGTVNFEDGVVLTAPNLSSIANFPLGAALQKAFRLPVVIENDANAAALGEMWFGAGRGYYAIVCVTLGTGVGGGIILDGRLWRGADGSAAEVGHISVEPLTGGPCTCGSRGCLELYASATGIARMAREALPLQPNSMLKDAGELKAEKVYEAGVAGDSLATEVFAKMGVYLGIGLADIVNLLNPEMIIIGGGVSNGWDLFHAPMRQQVTERAFPLPAQRVKIVKAQCGDDAGLLGAAQLAIDALA